MEKVTNLEGVKRLGEDRVSEIQRGKIEGSGLEKYIHVISEITEERSLKDSKSKKAVSKIQYDTKVVEERPR